MQIADIFRAHAVDCSERTLTLQTTGDVGKVRRAGTAATGGRGAGGAGGRRAAGRGRGSGRARGAAGCGAPAAAAPHPSCSLPLACVLPQIEAFKKSLSKFGLVELVRTGRISLKRGERVFDTGAWVPR